MSAPQLDPAEHCGCGHHADDHDGECLHCVCPALRLHWSRRSRFKLRTAWSQHPREKYAAAHVLPPSTLSILLGDAE